MRFTEFMAGQEIDSILGNVSKQATPQQKSMFQSVQPFIKTARNNMDHKWFSPLFRVL